MFFNINKKFSNNNFDVLVNIFTWYLYLKSKTKI